MSLIDSIRSNREDTDETIRMLESWGKGFDFDAVHAAMTEAVEEPETPSAPEPDELMLPEGDPEPLLPETTAVPNLEDTVFERVDDDDAADDAALAETEFNRRNIRSFAKPDIYDPNAYARNHEPVAAADIHVEAEPEIESADQRTAHVADLSHRALEAYTASVEAGAPMYDSPEARELYALLDRYAATGMTANEVEALQERFVKARDAVFYAPKAEAGERAADVPVVESAVSEAAPTQPAELPAETIETAKAEAIDEERARESFEREYWNGGGREAAKAPHRPSVIAQKWNEALLNPYFAVKNRVSAVTAPLMEWHDDRDRKKLAGLTEEEIVAKLDRRRQGMRLAFVLGSAAYTVYAHAMAMHGGGGGSGTLEYALQNAGARLSDHVGSGPGAHDVLASAFTPSPNAVDHAGMTGSHDGAPAMTLDRPSVVEAVPAAETSPVLAIKDGQGGEAWFRANGLPERLWHEHQDDMYRRFAGDLYKKGDQVFLNRQGMPSAGFQRYVTELKKGMH